MHPLHQLRKLATYRRAAAALDRPVWITLNGRRVRVRLMRHLSYVVRRRTEPAVTRLVRELVARHPIRRFWDVGANIGYYTWLVGVETVAFEPDPDNAALLRLSAAGLPVEVVEAAASDRAGVALFHPDPISSATGSLTESSFIARHYGAHVAPIEVRTVTLDDMLRGRVAPDLVKIDVEGSELAVFRGATELVRRQPIFLFECQPENRNAAATLLRGYRLSDLPADNVLALPPRLG